MRRSLTTLIAVVLALSGCERPQPSAPASVEIDEVVRTTTSPIDWMTRRIAGDLIPVEMLCPPDQNPSVWRPEPDVVARYQRARLIIVNGAEFEKWVLTAPLPRSRIVRTAAAIDGDPSVVRGDTHSHGPAGAHAHDEIDGHTWLDPINAIAQAGAIAEALASAFPEHASAITTNHASVADTLRAMHLRLESLNTSAVPIIAPESPYGYIARRYDWPTSKTGDDLAGWTAALEEMELDEPLGGRAHAVLLCESLPDDTTAEALLRSHGVLLVLWNTGELERDGGYADVLAANIDRLESAIAQIAVARPLPRER